ncbi:alpha/beta hydrolase [Nocardia sp. NPDC055321]
MSIERNPDHTDVVSARTIDVGGVRFSALCAEVDNPRAVVLALHGGATTARYFDLPDHPWLSLLRLGARLGFTVLALDRPGYGASAPWDRSFDAPERRVDATFAALDALLGESPRGAGVFVFGHSAGCDLAARLAADPRGDDLLGLELAGTGVDKQPEAIAIIEEIHRTRRSGAIRDLLWSPPNGYPDEVLGGRSLSSDTPFYETVVVRQWPADFPVLAERVRIPVRLTQAEHERVWRTDPGAVAELAALFAAAPRVVSHEQAGCGHNASVGFGAAGYHLGLLGFVEECVVRAGDLVTNSMRRND